MISLTRIYAVFLRQLYLLRSNPARLVSVFLWILIDVVQWGFISLYLGTFGRATFGFVTVILGAIVLWGFLNRIQVGVMMAFLEDVWSRNFLNLFASPLRVGEYLAGLVLTSITLGLAGLFAMVILAGLAFGYNILKVGLALLPFLAVLFVFGVAIGIFTSAIIFRFGPAAEWAAWPIPLILSVFSGVYYPVATLPAGLAVAAKFVPASYVFEGLRAVLSGGTLSGGLVAELASAAGLSLLYLFAMYYLFIRIYRRNLLTGRIARFDAEGI